MGSYRVLYEIHEGRLMVLVRTSMSIGEPFATFAMTTPTSLLGGFREKNCGLVPASFPRGDERLAVAHNVGIAGDERGPVGPAV